MNQAALMGGDPFPAGLHPAAQTLVQDRTRWVAMAVLLTPILCTTLLTKFAIPPYGALGIGISVMVIPLAIATGILAGCMRLDSIRLAMFLLVTGGIGLVPLLRGEAFSVNSVLLFAAVHVPFAFAVSAGRDSLRRITGIFLDICLLIAWLGIAQFFLQFVLEARYLFPIENFVPESFVVQGFNKQGLFGYGLDLFRSNGVFLLEPSYFAQLLAIAIVVELNTGNRLRRLPVYALSLLLAHSGTGLMILAVCLPLFVISRKRWDLLLFGVLLVAVLFVFRHYFLLDRLLDRVNEFDSDGSSGFARFVGGFYLFDEFLWNDPLRTLLGAGAGSFIQFAQRSDYIVAEMPLFKTLFEFGVLGSLAYFGFIVYCFFSGTRSWLMSLAILMSFLLNGLYIPFATAIALALIIWPAREDEEPLGSVSRTAEPASARDAMQRWPGKPGSLAGANIR